ncbi:MAG: AgmX/PglI C-terminal domain-containing protein [Kofleriaceae bacterium]
MVKLVVPMVLVSGIELGMPELSGPRNTDRIVEVDRVVGRKYPELVKCYADALAKSPSLGGDISVVLVVRPDGKVSGAGVAGFDAGVDACLKGVVKQLVFAPASEKSEVHYSWVTANLVSGAFASLTGTVDLSGGFDDPSIYGGLLGTEATVGAGSGWGTIGTGHYGTIGHGSGHGSGGMRGRSAAVPTVSIGQPVTSGKGKLDKAIIRRYIKRNIQKLQYCYEKELLSHPKLAGTVTVAFTIGASGKVEPTAKTSGMPETDACLVQVVQDIEFPKPKNDASVDVKHAFTFRPQGN